MSKKIYSLMAILMIASLVLVACGSNNADMADDAAAPVDFKVCEVTDLGGVDDKSFNQLAWKGVTDAEEQLGVDGNVLESQQQTDYEININNFIEEECDLILSIGFLLADATAAAAAAYPEIDFAIVDVDFLEFDNVVGVNFKADQGAFLAGYVSAATTKTGKIGTYGGVPIPPVTVFMDGFYLGAMYYNEVKGTSVEVIGWDPANPDEGLFTNNFESLEDARNLSITMIDEGVDILLGVGGPIGLGSGAAAQERGDVWIIGVDSDWSQTSPEYADVILTSILKKVDVGVFNTIKDAVEGNFEAGNNVYTLADGAIGLAGIENFSAELQAEIAELIEGIIAGDIVTSVPAAE